MIKTKDSKGITLISLVITVIVLLILAAIALSVLTGENSVLKRGAEARETTSTEQIKERIRLAYTAAITTGDGAITEDLLRQELTKEFGENGYELKDNEEDATKWEVKVKTTVEVIKKPANLAGGGSSSIELSYVEYETESRAVIIQVEVKGNVVTDEQKDAWLRTLTEDELKDCFAKAQSKGNATWDTMYGSAPFTNVNQYFNNYSGATGTYEDEYEWMIKTNKVYMAQYYEANGGLPMPITIEFNDENMVLDFINNSIAEFVVSKNGNYTITASNTAGDTGVITVNLTKCVNRKDNLPEEFSAIQTTNKTWEVEEGYSVTVPAGFAYGTSENIGKVTTGFVITDAVDSEGNSIGNEFVWIPIVEDESEILRVGNTTGKQFAEISSGTNYRGVLYDNWSSSSSSPITYNSTGYREPDAVSYYDTGDFASQGITANLMKKEYNDMIKSVKDNGGFYVSRYEMQKSTNNTAETKIGKMPISAASNEANMWYGLYKLAKTYQNSQDSVVSSMIWGSQYDAMLNFSILTGNDNEKIIANTNGNHTPKLMKAGTYNGTDSILNIFELEGNKREWTQEAESRSYRVDRGGGCYLRSAPSYRNSLVPYAANGDFSTRLALCIK